MRPSDVNVLSKEYLMEHGTYFDDDMGWAEDCEDQIVYGDGTPFEGLLYECYNNCNVAYYGYYTNGIKDGEQVRFYYTGELQSYYVLDRGLPKNKGYEWYENGNILRVTDHYKNDYHYRYVKYDEDGTIIKQGEV